MTHYCSNGTSFESRLTVYRDFINSNGKWRLFWENLADAGCGFDEQSTVTGKPFFDTKRAAVAYAERKYSLTPERASF